MKRITLFLSILVVFVAFVSCRGNKQQAPQDDKQPGYVFTKQDTVEVNSLVSHFITRLENKDIRSAVEMLSLLKGDSIFPLDVASQRRQAMALRLCQGVKYDVVSMDLNSDKNNEVKMIITLFEKEEGDPKPNKTSFYFRPVKFEGKWYLTTKDNITDMANQNKVEE